MGDARVASRGLPDIGLWLSAAHLAAGGWRKGSRAAGNFQEDSRASAYT